MSDKEKHHNDGQKDGSNGEYNSPRPSVLDDFVRPSWENEERHENADSYDEGWRHGNSQRD